MGELLDILGNMKTASVMVVGDLMLDTFIYGETDRISPEAPIPVLSVRRETQMLGGAGNVVSNLSGLGVKPYLFAVVGDDGDAETVRSIALSFGADIDGIVTDASRPTTTKTRFVAAGQQLLRTDFEKTHALPDSLRDDFLGRVKKALPDVQAMIISDYGKGLLTREVIAALISLAKGRRIPVLVDPKGRDFAIYRGADVITPNRKELSAATNDSPVKTNEEIVAAALQLIADCGIGHVVATRSEDGMSVIFPSAAPLHLRAQVREVFDVSGAGDTVIATIAAALACKASLEQAARLANLAGGIVVGKTGTTPVFVQELMQAVSGGHAGVVSDWNAAKRQIGQWKADGLSVGFTNGCFDILHYGHVTYLQEAKNRCDRLVVGINRDASVRLLKGPTRPVNDETARGAVLAALGAVDMVVYFGAEKTGEDNTPSALIDSLRPDVIFKGGDYRPEDLPEAAIARSYGGRVEIMGLQNGFSTTATIARMKDST